MAHWSCSVTRPLGRTQTAQDRPEDQTQLVSHDAPTRKKHTCDTAERAEKTNALAKAAELRAAAAVPAPETAAPEPAAPGSSAPQDPTEARIVAAVAEAMRGQLSSNTSTNKFNAAVAAMGPEKFTPQGKQTLENWLRSAKIAFRFSQLEEASWGSALVMCLDSNSRSAVYAQFAQQEPQEDFSWDAVVEVLTQILWC